MNPYRDRRWAFLAVVLVAGACSGVASDTTSTTQRGTSTTTSSTTLAPTSTSPPAEPTSVEVAIPAEGLELAGTLRLPGGGNLAPAVVLIHGSGPNSRDQPLPGQLNLAFGFEIPVFAQLADALRDAGYAVLTYDKRSCGPFNGCADNDYPMPDAEKILIDDFIADAQSAVAFLRQRTEVDPARVSVVGHSQGAQFIPIMLEADPLLDKGAMLAGPFRPIDDILQFQLDSSVELLTSLGLPEDDARANPGVVGLADLVAAAANIRGGSDQAVGGASAAFWRGWFALHERGMAALAVIGQPLLVLNGTLDWNVPPGEADLWDAALSEAGADYTVALLPCVTHALNCVTESDPTAIAPGDLGRDIATEVLDGLLDFLGEG